MFYQKYMILESLLSNKEIMSSKFGAAEVFNVKYGHFDCITEMRGPVGAQQPKLSMFFHPKHSHRVYHLLNNNVVLKHSSVVHPVYPLGSKDVSGYTYWICSKLHGKESDVAEVERMISDELKNLKDQQV